MIEELFTSLIREFPYSCFSFAENLAIFTDIGYNNTSVMDVPRLCSDTLRFLNYNNFQAALNQSGLGAAIDKPGITVLAYSNDVFTSVNSSGSTLRQNIIEGFIGYTPSLAGKDHFTTVDNKTLNISLRDGTYYVNESPISKSDIICSNGVIHSLGKVCILFAPPPR